MSGPLSTVNTSAGSRAALAITSDEQVDVQSATARAHTSFTYEQLFGLYKANMLVYEQLKLSSLCRDVHIDNVWLARPLRIFASVGIACEDSSS